MFGLFRDLHAVAPLVLRVPDDYRDRLARLGQVVRNVRDEVCALGGLDHERVREAVHVDTVFAVHAVGPIVRELQAVSANYVEAHPAGELSDELEA